MTGPTPAADVVYDLVSIQYHALKGAQLYDKFLSDAQGDDEVSSFIRRVRDEDTKRAESCHQLLTRLTKDGLHGSSSGRSSSSS